MMKRRMKSFEAKNVKPERGETNKAKKNALPPERRAYCSRKSGLDRRGFLDRFDVGVPFQIIGEERKHLPSRLHFRR